MPPRRLRSCWAGTNPSRARSRSPPAVTFDDIALIASEITGRRIERVVVDDEQWVADQVAHGSPEPMARMLLTYFHAARAGHFAAVDPALTELLGREPRSVRDLLAERVAG
jgi:NAD(P)H dehydrogenase (quinone)